MAALTPALRYAALGWHVFPVHEPAAPGVCSCAEGAACGRPGKHPRVPHGLHEASADEGQIRRWWGAWPRASIGLRTGAISGVWILDIDAGTPAEDRLRDLENRHGDLPLTMESLTGGGGRHLLWRWPEGRAIATRNKLKIDGARVDGFDVRADGGYAILPPSVHAEDSAYTWRETAEIVDAPAWLLDVVDPPRPPPRPYEPAPPSATEREARWVEAALEGACRDIAGMTDGRRAALLNQARRFAGYAAAGLVDVARVEHELVRAGEASGTRHNVPRTVADGIRYGLPHPIRPDLPDEPPRRPMDATRDTSDDGDDIGSPSISLPVIKIGPNIHDTNDKAIRALRIDQGLYQRAGGLVDTVPDPESKLSEIHRLNEHALRDRLSRVTIWKAVKQTKDGEKEDRVPPPLSACREVLARGHWPGIRHLAAIVHEPTLRPDGTVLQAPGYDASTGVLYEPAGRFPRIPDHPTKADAIAAKDALLEVIADFPASTAGQAGWLAGVLTLLARHAIAGPCPLFFVDANVRGSGKSKMATVAGLIGTGREPAAAAAPTGRHPDEELRKRLTAIILRGARMAMFDNVRGEFGWPSLEALLTTTRHGDRVLGASIDVDLDARTVWWATANNAEIVGDMNRRIIPIRLVSSEERPEDRTGFKHPNLEAWVRQERARLVVASLTLLRAYCAAGRPGAGDLAPFGSYEAWSALVRGAVTWVGCPDPLETRASLEGRDEALTLWSRVLIGLDALYGSEKWWTTRDLLEAVRAPSAPPHAPPPPDPWADLRADLAELCRSKDGSLKPIILGKRFNTHLERYAKGRCLHRRLSSDNVAEWNVWRAA